MSFCSFYNLTKQLQNKLTSRHIVMERKKESSIEEEEEEEEEEEDNTGIHENKVGRNFKSTCITKFKVT